MGAGRAESWLGQIYAHCKYWFDAVQVGWKHRNGQARVRGSPSPLAFPNHILQPIPSSLKKSSLNRYVHTHIESSCSMKAHTQRTERVSLCTRSFSAQPFSADSTDGTPIRISRLHSEECLDPNQHANARKHRSAHMIVCTSPHDCMHTYVILRCTTYYLGGKHSCLRAPYEHVPHNT